MLAEQTELSKHGAHIGVTTYGWPSADLLIKLGDHTEYKKFAAAIDGLLANRKRERGTILKLGLEKSLNEMFDAANGARPDTKKALILVTDGDCNGCHTDAEKLILSNLAQRIKDEGIKMLMIGVGKTYDEMTRFDVSQFVGRDDFYELQDYSDITGPELIKEMAVVCDGMQLHHLQI